MKPQAWTAPRRPRPGAPEISVPAKSARPTRPQAWFQPPIWQAQSEDYVAGEPIKPTQRKTSWGRLKEDFDWGEEDFDGGEEDFDGGEEDFDSGRISDGGPRSMITPLSRTTISSVSRMVDDRWAMRRTARSSISAPSATCTSCACSSSSADVASSRTSTGASLRKARAIAMRWRCPPDNRVPRSPHTVA